MAKRTNSQDDATPRGASSGEALGGGLELQLDQELASGEQVGEYEIVEIIGAGGFGTVYRAIHPLIGKPAAVKVLSRQLSALPETVSRFIAEARAVNTIRHRNIVDVFNFGTLPDGRLYFVMELLEGRSMDRHLQIQGAITPEQLAEIMGGVCRALDAAHRKDVVHRDLKPENIFLNVDEDGVMTPKLLDFGIAKLLGDDHVRKHLTQTGSPLGTPHYMSSEQCLALEIDHRSDIYAFGVVCFEALTGRTAFEGASLLALMNQHTTAERPLVSAAAPELGTFFDDAICRMMHIDREKRPRSAGKALLLLEGAVARWAEAREQPAPAPAEGARSTDRGRETVDGPSDPGTLGGHGIRKLETSPTELHHGALTGNRRGEDTPTELDALPPAARQPVPSTSQPSAQNAPEPGARAEPQGPFATNLEAILGHAEATPPAPERRSRAPLWAGLGASAALLALLIWLGWSAPWSATPDASATGSTAPSPTSEPVPDPAAASEPHAAEAASAGSGEADSSTLPPPDEPTEPAPAGDTTATTAAPAPAPTAEPRASALPTADVATIPPAPKPKNPFARQ